MTESYRRTPFPEIVSAIVIVHHLDGSTAEAILLPGHREHGIDATVEMDRDVHPQDGDELFAPPSMYVGPPTYTITLVCGTYRLRVMDPHTATPLTPTELNR